MTAVSNVAPRDLWLPLPGSFWNSSRRRTNRRFADKVAGEWHRLVINPLLAIDRAGVELSTKMSDTNAAASATRTAASSTASSASTTRPINSSGASPSAEISTPSEIHTLEPAAQLQYLVENFSDAVYRVARSVVRENELAEDASQEALLKAWQALPTFRGDAPLRNWVLRITHNTAVSILRSRREEVRDPELLPDSVQTGAVERSVEDTMAMTAFEDALGQLDELSRSIVVLREIENMSYDEIAETLDVPLPTVKTRLLRARKVLSSALKEWRP